MVVIGLSLRSSVLARRARSPRRSRFAVSELRRPKDFFALWRRRCREQTNRLDATPLYGDTRDARHAADRERQAAVRDSEDDAARDKRLADVRERQAAGRPKGR